MRNRNLSVRILVWLAGVSLCLAAIAAQAQVPDLGPPLGAGPDDAGFPSAANEGVLGEGDRVPKFEAGFTAPAPDHTAQLFILATLPPGSHTYSITQPPGGPLRTVITVDTSADVPMIGKFQTVGLPQIEHDEDAFPGLPLEQHSGTAKWVAPIQLAPSARPEAVKIQGKVKVQLCDAKGCVQPKDYAFTAMLRPDVRAVAVAPQSPKATPVSAPPSAAPPVSNPTANPSPPPITMPPGITSPPSSPAAYPPVPANTVPPPTVAPLNSAAPVPASSLKPAETAKQRAATGDGEIDWLPFTDVADLKQMVGKDFDVGQIRENVRNENAGLGLLRAIFAGFVGGLILNIMPCVLPVIGLKIISFVEQSGHSRRKAFALNAWYSLGLLAVFFVLATLAVLLHLGLGELFGKSWFTIALAAIVFVMSLSFMGVWEVPLPTFLGGGKTGALAAQEGAAGAFFKGVLTTFLATPCSAPLFGPAIAWATSQPAVLTYTVFLSAGLGMASPYLLVGAFPELLRFLPKPGAWMETFKQLMGFVLMGTVVYLLAVIKPQYAVPTVGLLLALAFMCWWGNRGSLVQDVATQLRAWVQGVVVVGLVWIVMFPGLDERVLGRFHFSGLAAVMANQFATPPVATGAAPRVVGPNTVLVAFTADWCQTCHFNERTVLDTEPVIDSLRRKGVVTVKADWSQDSPEVTEMLDLLGSRQIPVIAIFSARNPNHPSVFRGGYTQAEILAALEKAGPSPGAGGT